MINWTVPGPATPTAVGDYSGYATGSDVHASASNLADIEEAFSGSSVNSQGLSSDIVDTDLADQPLVQAANANANSGARGSGVEVGLAPPAPLTNQIILSQLATATASPDSGPVSKQIGPLHLDPVLEASVLKGTAQAAWSPGGCVLGSPISQGTGEATNLGLVGTGSITPLGVVGSPGAAHSQSSEALVPQVDKNGKQVGDGIGLMSQVVETVAPLQLGLLTITVVGPWELQAVALGTGGSYVGYGPAPSPQQAGILNGTIPAVTISTGPVTINSISFQQLLGPNGFSLPIPNIGTVSIAAPPRAIGGASGSAPTVSAQSVSAAADLIQVSVGGPVNVVGNSVANVDLVDVRVGHMVASATVGAGGLQCPIPVAKTASPQNVNPGDSLTYSINISNPYNCALTNLKLVDSTSANNGVAFAIGSESPPADSHNGGVLTWSHLDPLAPGASESLTVHVTISARSRAGTLTETAKVTGSCGVGTAQGTATVGVPLAGAVTINAPTISSGIGQALPVTGGRDGRYYAVALLVTLVAVGLSRRGITALLTADPA